MTSEQMTIPDALQKAVDLHRTGNLQDAERIYRAIIHVQPKHPDANHNLGVLAVQVGKPELGLPFFKLSLETNPNQDQFWISYIDCLIHVGNVDVARHVLAQGRSNGLNCDTTKQMEARITFLEQAKNIKDSCSVNDINTHSHTKQSKTKLKIKPKKPITKQKFAPLSREKLSPPLKAKNAIIQHFNAKRYSEAEYLARQLVLKHPDDAFGFKALGSILAQCARSNEAVSVLETALRCCYNDYEVLNSLGNALKNLGRLNEAVLRYEKALRIKPDFAEAHYNLGNALKDLGRLDEAVLRYERAQSIKPDYAEAHNNMGNALKYLGRLDEAVLRYEKALSIKPDFAEAHYNMGNALNDLGRLDEAVLRYEKVLSIKPDYAEAHYNMGNALNALGRLDEAVLRYERALLIKPDYAEAHNNMGNALKGLGRLDEAMQRYEKALLIKPEFAEAYNNMGIVLKDLGRLEEAVERYKKALLIKPDFAEAHNNLGGILRFFSQYIASQTYLRRALQLNGSLGEAHAGLSSIAGYLSDFTEVVSESDLALICGGGDVDLIWEARLYMFSYHPDLAVEQIYSEFVRWGDRFSLPPADHFPNHDRNLKRRLRVGYVSPDFRRHTSRFYFSPLFSHHAPQEVELYAYSNVCKDDEYTEQFKSMFHHWRDIRGVTAEDVAQRIREDQVDILVDVCNHMQGDRLDVFRLKPAPIQVTWLGAAWTTGLPMIDYVLFDPYMAPEGTLTREKIIRLPQCFVAYRPPEETAEVVAAPVLTNGYITFGYSGRTERLNHRVFRAWGEILRRLPTARLILDFHAFADPPTQDYYRKFLKGHGIDINRVEMRCSKNIFKGLCDIDILLDCFPHSGGTMLFDALWMGVPALTIAGRPPVGRIGTSLMMNLGLPEWVTHSEADYIDRAVEQALDVENLAELRAGMRQRMKNSPLMDEAGFAKGVEQSYRNIWQVWCQEGS